MKKEIESFYLTGKDIFITKVILELLIQIQLLITSTNFLKSLRNKVLINFLRDDHGIT